jgi:uncharacterized protein
MIVDADAHVAECPEIFADYLEPAYARRRPRLIPESRTRGWWDFDGVVVPRREGAGRGPERGFAAGTACNDVARRRAFMADEQIDLMVVFPNSLIAACSLPDADYACALVRAYNDWVADHCRECGPDVRAVALVALQDPAEAVKELRRAVDDLGLVGAVLPSMIGTRLIGDEAFVPFFEEAVRLDVPVGLHDVTGAYDLPGQQMFDTFFATRTVARPFGFMTALLSLMNEGHFERWPTLRVALFENGVGWLPYWIERMDGVYETQRQRGNLGATPWLRRPPSEYVRRGQVFCHCESTERGLPDAVAYLGEGLCSSPPTFPTRRSRAASCSGSGREPTCPRTPGRRSWPTTRCGCTGGV